MKKLITLALVATMLCLTACSSSYDSYESSKKEAVTSDNSTSGAVYETSAKKSSGASSFSNKYGTSTTKCAHPGCDNEIASTGDTNCCPGHSNRCAECGCYIDEDALYCMSCLSKAAGAKSSKNSVPETGAGGYEMPNENDDSFEDYVKRVDPELYKEVFGD